MTKKKLGIIIGCNTAITTAAVCLVFMKNGDLPDETAK